MSAAAIAFSGTCAGKKQLLLRSVSVPRQSRGNSHFVLERILQRELNDSRIVAHRSDDPEGRGPRSVGQARIGKAWVVESIEEIRPELHVGVFLRPMHRHALAERHINIDLIRPPQHAVGSVPKAQGRWVIAGIQHCWSWEASFVDVAAHSVTNRSRSRQILRSATRSEARPTSAFKTGCSAMFRWSSVCLKIISFMTAWSRLAGVE